MNNEINESTDKSVSSTSTISPNTTQTLIDLDIDINQFKTKREEDSSSKLEKSILNLGMMEIKTFNDLDDFELKRRCSDMGYPDTANKPRTKLLRDLLEAYMVERHLHGQDTQDLNVNSAYADIGTWEMAKELRLIGISNETIRHLIDYHVQSNL